MVFHAIAYRLDLFFDMYQQILCTRVAKRNIAVSGSLYVSESGMTRSHLGISVSLLRILTQ